LLISLNELEKLKPLVQQKINELNSRNAHQQNGRGNFYSNSSVDFSPAKNQTLPSNNGQIKVKYAGKFSFKGCSSPVIFVVTLPYIFYQAVRATAKEFVYQGSSGQQFTYVRPVEEQVRRL
jgi:STAM-binding protein